MAETRGIPVERLRAMIRLLSPGEITPIAKRQLELLCQEYERAQSLGPGVEGVDQTLG